MVLKTCGQKKRLLAALLLVSCAGTGTPPSVEENANLPGGTPGATLDREQITLERVDLDFVPGYSGCLADHVASRALRVEGDPAYVNAEVFSASADRILLAGFPNYIWPVGPEGRQRPLADSIFGVVLGPDEEVTTVPLPMSGHLGYPRAVPRTEGGWHVVFAELAESIHDEISPQITALWAGLLIGREWSDLERLPVPLNYELDYTYAASLLRSGAVLALAVVTRKGGQVILFERTSGGWSWELVTRPGARGRYPEPAGVSNVALIPWQGGVALLARKTDVQPDAMYESLFRYTREEHWSEQIIVADIKPHVTGFHAVARSDVADVLSWVSDDRVVGYMGTFEREGLRPFVIDSSLTRGTTGLTGITSISTLLIDGTPFWIAQPRTPDESRDLRLFLAAQDTVELIGTITHPHWRLQAGAETAKDVVVAAANFHPESEASATGAVSSRLLSIPVQCSGSRQ